jgi:hypothetical protein
MKYDDYNDLKNGLKNLPMTWYPALILEMVKAAYKKNVYLPGGASKNIKQAEQREGLDK